MTSRDVTLLNSLVDYVLDVKPYHTKIKQFLSELFFSDNFNVNVTENLGWKIYHQNVWTRDDVGGYHLQRLCEGIEIDKNFRIPASIWPRWSLNDHAGQQTPPGNDPATNVLIDLNLDGIPDSEQSWTGSNSSSHFLGSDHVPGDIFTYRVPFHQGSRVYVDGILQTYGSPSVADYTIDNTRSFIRFTVAPGDLQHIEVQLFKVDRLFIAYNLPFDHDVDYNFDSYGFDLLRFDTDDINFPSIQSDFFQFTIDASVLEGHGSISFFNSIPSNVPKASLTVLGVGPNSIDGESWKITAIGPWKFKVERIANPGFDLYGFDDEPFDTMFLSSDPGFDMFYDFDDSPFDTGNLSPDPDWYASFKQIFDNGYISFIIDRVWSDYYLVPDNDSYDSFDLLSFDNFNGPVDDTDFMVGLNLITEHGVVVDPVPSMHRPMEFVMKDHLVNGGYDLVEFGDIFDDPEPLFVPGFSIGTVKKIQQQTIVGPQDYYSFALTKIPSRGTYVEFRIEQNGQLNNWFNSSITDDMYLRVSWPAGATIDQLDPFDVLDFDNHEYDTIPLVILPGTTKLIHNVNIGGELIYEESQDIDELILYHGRGGDASAILVEHLGVPIAMSLVYLGKYFEGVELPPDFIGIDKQRIIIRLSSPQTIKVTLTF